MSLFYKISPLEEKFLKNNIFNYLNNKDFKDWVLSLPEKDKDKVVSNFERILKEKGDYTMFGTILIKKPEKSDVKKYMENLPTFSNKISGTIERYINSNPELIKSIKPTSIENYFLKVNIDGSNVKIYFSKVIPSVADLINQKYI